MLNTFDYNVAFFAVQRMCLQIALIKDNTLGRIKFTFS
jgi:hypothetical protein